MDGDLSVLVTSTPTSPIKQVVQQPQEPQGVHGNGAGCLFYLEDENGTTDTAHPHNVNQLCMISIQKACDVVIV